MANRYDRDPDEYGPREPSREPSREDPRRPARQEAQGRFGDERYGRQTPWQGGQHERESESDWRARENRGEGNRDERWRGGAGSSDNNYYASHENQNLGGYYSSGRDYDRHQDRQQGPSERSRSDWGRHEERPNFRGYQEQGWARDPGRGNAPSYEYSTRGDPRRFNAGDETNDRWRTDVGDQNRRFDIDRGWRGTSPSGTGGYGTGGYGTSGYGTSGAGTSGYGSTTRGQSQVGKGPKGYVRSDERIREDVCDRLSDDDEVDAGDITVTVKNAEVILEGTVNDRRSKHRAEDIAESISGVKEVTNHLRARKGILQEIGDKLSGTEDAEHHGHAGSGTRNSTTGTAPRTAH